ALFQMAVQRLAVNKFHDEVGCLCSLVNAHVMQRQNARVGDLPNDSCFLKEAVASGAACDLGGEDLDGDNAADEGVMRAHDAAKGASANSVENFVASDLHVHLHSREITASMRLEKGAGGGNEAIVLYQPVRPY